MTGSNRLSLQALLNDLIVAFAEESFGQYGTNLSELFEVSLARAMDAAIGTLFPEAETAAAGHTLDSPSTARTFEGALQVFVRQQGDERLVAAALSSAFERARGLRLSVDPDGRITVETSPERRGKGIYFTPHRLAEELVKPALSLVLASVIDPSGLANVKIVDPAAGCGAFLLASIRVASEILIARDGFSQLSLAELQAEIASNCIFGVDLDPIAIATTRALIRAQVGLTTWNSETLDKHLHVADAVGSSIQDWARWFPSVFPGGFSLVVTNPPWSKLRPLRHEFFQHMDARVRLYQGTQLGRYLSAHLDELVCGDWEEYARRTQALSSQLRSSAEYTINSGSTGDADLYKFFTERSLALLGSNGIAALLLPSGVLRAQGSTGLRSLLRTCGRVKRLVEYINRKNIFDIHSMYRFCSVLFQKGTAGGVDEAAFREDSVMPDRARQYVGLNSDFLASVGGNDLLIPEVRTADERDLLLRLYRSFPTSAQATSGWRFNFRRELDMTNDADAFISLDQAMQEGYKKTSDGRWHRDSPASTLLPVYEGRMVHQFDHCAKVYEAGHGRSAKWSIPPPGEGHVIPHFLVPEAYAIQRGWRPGARIGYCEISGHANERTLLAALLPEHCVCGNKVPVLQLHGASMDDQFLWLAYANSFVVDWIFRRFVSTTVNHFYWKNVPLPAKGSKPELEQLLVRAARKLSDDEVGQQPANAWLGHRALLRATVDVIVMEMYGISDSERATVLNDFPQVLAAHSRGEAGSVSIESLLHRAGEVLRAGRLDLDSIELSIGLPATEVAAAYTPRDQAMAFLHPRSATVSRRSAQKKIGPPAAAVRREHSGHVAAMADDAA
ncbi:N-6 DNA methylase [Caballeronia sp. ATUFL_M2_KS44]|uniref:Eco57I restriction-modification methylase domain-containing protein n=1 Tax=Caballeronia sp. ATUFL_M2_KS44 TaxID=2921767 RepID=UPI002028B746|nr:N-6 DNA methylase [Caballeronia sp. ATUFL_M2_KS44]